jgi:peptidoglycan hydrolase CwlO-like protein
MTEIIIGVVTAIAGVGVTSYWTGIINARREKANEKLANNQQAVDIYRNLLERTDKMVDELGDDIEELNKQHMAFREENVLLKEKLKSCK